MPPVPSRQTTSYAPMRVPAASAICVGRDYTNGRAASQPGHARNSLHLPRLGNSRRAGPLSADECSVKHPDRSQSGGDGKATLTDDCDPISESMCGTSVSDPSTAAGDTADQSPSDVVSQPCGRQSAQKCAERIRVGMSNHLIVKAIAPMMINEAWPAAASAYSTGKHRRSASNDSKAMELSMSAVVLSR